MGCQASKRREQRKHEYVEIREREPPEIERIDENPFWSQESAVRAGAERQGWQEQLQVTFTGVFCDTCLPL